MPVLVAVVYFYDTKEFRLSVRYLTAIRNMTRFGYLSALVFGYRRWPDTVSNLSWNGRWGSIDIEGWLERSMTIDLEMRGWVRVLNCLKACGAQFVPARIVYIRPGLARQ